MMRLLSCLSATVTVIKIMIAEKKLRDYCNDHSHYFYEPPRGKKVQVEEKIADKYCS